MKCKYETTDGLCKHTQNGEVIENSELCVEPCPNFENGGCRYCKSSTDIEVELAYDEFNIAYLVPDEKRIYTAFTTETFTVGCEIPVDYCPKCGRKLET